MEFKNKKIRIFKAEYSIEYVENAGSSDGEAYLYGYTDTDAKRIFISVKSDEKDPLSEDFIDGAFRLELIRASRHELQSIRNEISESLYIWLNENMEILYKLWALNKWFDE